MQKDIKIGTKAIPMKATASTALRYRQVFQGNLFKELTENTNEEQVDTIQRLAYIMAQAGADADMSALSKDGYMEWLDQFEAIDLVEALPQVVALYSGNKVSTSKAKKK